MANTDIITATITELEAIIGKMDKTLNDESLCNDSHGIDFFTMAQTARNDLNGLVGTLRAKVGDTHIGYEDHMAEVTVTKILALMESNPNKGLVRLLVVDFARAIHAYHCATTGVSFDELWRFYAKDTAEDAGEDIADLAFALAKVELCDETHELVLKDALDLLATTI